MKFKVMMKDPDTLHDAIREAVKKWSASLREIDEDERESIAESRETKVGELCSKWFEYGEYLQVEIDTDAKTCTVVPFR